MQVTPVGHTKENSMALMGDIVLIDDHLERVGYFSCTVADMQVKVCTMQNVFGKSELSHRHKLHCWSSLR